MKRMKRANHQSLDEVELANSCVSGPEPHSRQDARASFLRTIKKHRPDVLESLRRDVWHVHSKLFHPDCGIPLNQAILNQSEDTISFNPQSSNWYNYFFWNCRLFSTLGREVLVPDPYQERLVLLKEAISNWAERFQLTDEWCLDYILATLYEWSQSDQPDDWRCEQRAPLIEGDPERHFKFEFFAWHVDAEDWASYKKRLNESFNAYLLAYRVHQENSAKSRKIDPARKKRAGMHYFWLVDFHIPQPGAKTLSDTEIAERYDGGSGLDRSTVYEAIHSTASLIGLTLRKR
jgi:hypothetical protein